MVNDKLKKLIFDKLYNDLKKVEIISYDDSIWLIDRENKFWYFRYIKDGSILYYRVFFFDGFFRLFCMEYEEYKWIISEWVEEVLNYKVKIPTDYHWNYDEEAEEVLNCKVEIANKVSTHAPNMVQEVLNYGMTPHIAAVAHLKKMKDVLKYKVEAHVSVEAKGFKIMEEVLNHKVEGCYMGSAVTHGMVDDVLNDTK